VPFRILPEERYVEERVVMPASGSLAYMRVLKTRLSENRCVWIYGENAPGRKPVSAPFLGRTREFPTGAPALAFSTGASLITTHVERVSQGHYRLLFDDPFAEDRNTGKSEWVERAVHRYAERLESEIRRHPTDWNGWEGPWAQKVLAAKRTVDE
jgi:lauroyl/myristoyl acyltransferase